jgi:Major Facilitator Superfamily
MLPGRRISSSRSRRSTAPGVLRCNVVFRRLWAAQTISVFGDAITLVALPTAAILVLHAGSLTVGALTAAAWLAYPLGPLAGVWVDRLPRRPLMVTADALRCLLIASIPFAYAFGVLTVWQLAGVAALAGVGTVVGGLASTSYLPDVVAPDDLTVANARLELSNSASLLAGPSLAGVAVGAIGAPAALVGDAISFAASATIVATAPPVRERSLRGTRGRFHTELWEGVRTLATHRVMRATAFAASVSNFGLAMTQALLFVYAYRALDLSPAAVGVALTLGAVGNVVGAAAASKATAHLGTGRSLLLSTTVEGFAGLLLPLAIIGAPILFLATGLFVRGCANPLWQVNAVTLRQRTIAPALQARVTAASRALGMGTLPLGAVAGGALGVALAARLGERGGLALALTAAAVIAGSSGLALASRPVRTLQLDSSVSTGRFRRRTTKGRTPESGTASGAAWTLQLDDASARQRDLRQAGRSVDVGTREHREPHGGDLARHDRHERAQPLGHGSDERQRRLGGSEHGLVVADSDDRQPELVQLAEEPAKALERRTGRCDDDHGTVGVQCRDRPVHEICRRERLERRARELANLEGDLECRSVVDAAGDDCAAVNLPVPVELPCVGE